MPMLVERYEDEKGKKTEERGAEEGPNWVYVRKLESHEIQLPAFHT